MEGELKLKILYVATISDTIGFFISHIKKLVLEGHSVDIACNIGKPVPSELLDIGCQTYDVSFQRSPLSSSNIVAYKQLKDLIIARNYDIVHTHTPIASVITRLVCRNIKNIKVIYTAHGFHFYTGAPLKNWLIYYPIEKWLAKYTSVLITINTEDYNRAKKYFRAGKVVYIPGVGLDTEKFKNVSTSKKILRKQFEISEDSFLLLSLGELNKNKNHETVIKALAKINDPNIYYVICGEGPCRSKLENLINVLGLTNQVKLLGFRQDITDICSISDMFIFPSFREGLSVALMEAMASGLPVVCSDIRGNRDLIHEDKGGFLVKPTEQSSFIHAISILRNDREVRENMGLYNKTYIKGFDINTVQHKLNDLSISEM